VHIKLTVNGASYELDIEERTTLLDALRDHLALKGAHAGCEHGVCGACTVLLDGVAVRSCLMFAPQAEGSAITTVEGITPSPGELSPIHNPEPTREEIVEAISGNICRCTGYAQIVEAISLAAERMRGVNRPAELTK
jgi:carbon-monoxide dehydrogenase small subunit